MRIEEVLKGIRDLSFLDGKCFNMNYAYTDYTDKEKEKTYKCIVQYTNGSLFICDKENHKLFNEYSIGYLLGADFEIRDGIMVGNLELRGNNKEMSCSEGCDMEEADTLEIICWDKSYDNYFSIGFWKEDIMGFSFIFSGNSFLSEKINQKDLVGLIKDGQEILDDKFKELLERNIQFIKTLRGEE